MKYVIHGCERLRDGIEEWARVVSSLEEAEAYLDKRGNGFAACNMSFKVFELGKEVGVAEETVEQPQPARTSRKFKVGGNK